VSSPKFEHGTSRYDSKELLLKPGVQTFSRNLSSLQKITGARGLTSNSCILRSHKCWAPDRQGDFGARDLCTPVLSIFFFSPGRVQRIGTLQYFRGRTRPVGHLYDRLELDLSRRQHELVRQGINVATEIP